MVNTVPTWNGTLMVCWRRSGNISVWHVFTQSRREWIQIMRTLLYCHPRGGLLRISATESTKIWSNNLNSMSHFLYSMILALDSSKLSVCQRMYLVPGFLLGVDPAFPVSSPQKFNHQLHRPLGVWGCVWMHMIGKDNLGPRIRMCYKCHDMHVRLPFVVFYLYFYWFQSTGGLLLRLSYSTYINSLAIFLDV